MRHANKVVFSLIVAGITVCALFGAAENSKPGQTDYLGRLKAYLLSADANDSGRLAFEISDPEKWILEAGETAIPMLSQVLSGGLDDQRGLSTYFLALIGGPKSRDQLKKEYDRSHSTFTKTQLCFCMSSTGEAQDVEFLIESLSGEHYGDDWPPIEAAALSLGVLRPSKALPALNACAAKEPGSIASHAAEQAIRWMTSRPAATPQVDEAPEREQAILATLRSGIPRTDESNVFFEKEHNLRWVFQDCAWRFQQVVTDIAVKDAPGITFDVYITSDHSKAMIAVGMTFGRLNGKGYNYVLRKEKGKWKVVGILSTWIS